MRRGNDGGISILRSCAFRWQGCDNKNEICWERAALQLKYHALYRCRSKSKGLDGPACNEGARRGAFAGVKNRLALFGLSCVVAV